MILFIECRAARGRTTGEPDMKILIVNSLFPPVAGCGGAEKAVMLLSEGLIRRGYEVIVVSLHSAEEEKEETDGGVRVYRLPIDNIYWPFPKSHQPSWRRLAWHLRDRWNPKAARRVGRILDAEKPDVVNTHNLCGFSGAVWREVKRRQIRLVHTMHDYYLVCQRSMLFSARGVCTRRCLECRLLSQSRIRQSRNVDAVISVSRRTLELHRSHGCFQGVPGYVVSNIFPAGNLRPPPAPRAGTSGLVFGFIGTLHAAKGIETLLEAARMLPCVDWRLEIAGAGESGYVQRLQRQYANPRICWRGFMAADEFYASIDVVVIPSLWPEPLPYVCVEALHAGKAIVSSDSGGIPEICSLGGRASIVPAGDSKALAAAMTAAIADARRSKTPDAGSRGNLQQFDEDQVIDRYTDVYFEQSRIESRC